MPQRIWYRRPGYLAPWCEATIDDLAFLRSVCRPGTLFAIERLTPERRYTMSLRASLPMITIEMLLAKGACADQVALFRETFGDSAAVTLENCMKALSVGLFISWAAENFLSPPAREAYERDISAAQKAFERDISAAQKAFERDISAAQKAFERDIAYAQEAAAREAYERDIAYAREAYERDIAYARGAYRRATAVAFFAVVVEHAELAIERVPKTKGLQGGSLQVNMAPHVAST